LSPYLPVDFFDSPFFSFPSVSFSFFSFLLGSVGSTIINWLTLNYTQTRDRNSMKQNDGKMKKGWKPFFPPK
jgi:hypothetical protein